MRLLVEGRPYAPPVLLALLLTLLACDGARTVVPEPRPVQAPLKNTFCPRLVPVHLPPGWIALDAELVNLGKRTFGRIDTFGVGTAADAPHVEIYVGVDGLEALEDLDFEPSVISASGRSLRLYRTPVEETLFAVKDRHGDGPCAERTLISRDIAAEELVAIAVSLQEDEKP